jgi:hypothetical protein
MSFMWGPWEKDLGVDDRAYMMRDLGGVAGPIHGLIDAVIMAS